MIFEPINVHGIKLKNRIIMGSMHTGLEDAKDEHRSLTEYFVERAKHDLALAITGGYSPNYRGRLTPFSSQLSSNRQLKKHQYLTSKVGEHDCKMILQILHSGRYGHHPFTLAPSALQAPISKFKPKELSSGQIEKTISHFERCAKLAKKSGYSGVEIMGSEGYLLNQFLAPRTNKRKDKWGGDIEGRSRFSLEIVRRVKSVLKNDSLLIFRISLLDLVEEGSTWEEVIYLAKCLEKEGVSILNSGIGWHEARVPTIATNVPRAGYKFATAELKKHVSIPLVAVNRFNNSKDIEECLSKNEADFVSMARPFLADSQLVSKIKNKQDSLVNTCIACNQACLDHIFQGKNASCLVNPRACEELKFPLETKVNQKKKVLIIGAGVAGLSCAVNAAQLGHEVSLYESQGEIGGQFNYAKKVPGKADFYETLRYYKEMIHSLKVKLELNREVKANEDLSVFDEIVIATGVKPRLPSIKGIDHPKVLHYDQVFKKEMSLSGDVAIIGAGGIGFDVASYLLGESKDFYKDWSIDQSFEHQGGLVKTLKKKNDREIYLLKRSEGKFGGSLGKTTGWIKRMKLKKNNVKMLSSLKYIEINDDGLIIERDGKQETLKVDHVIICAGQVKNSLEREDNVHIIGGALKAGELDAKRAIRDGFELARNF